MANRIFYPLLCTILMTLVITSTAMAQGAKIVRPALTVAEDQEATQIAKPGEYSLVQGDFLELECLTSQPLKNMSSTVSPRGILAANGPPKPVVVPGADDDGRKVFRFIARRAGNCDIALSINGIEYNYAITVEARQGGGGGNARFGNARLGKARLGQARYTATQADGKVVITANGMNPTPGHRSFFEQAEIEIWPPQFRFMIRSPKGAVTQVMSPFSVQTSFDAADPVQAIEITDRDGTHTIEVAQPEK